jgi:hypothetical protein
MSDTPLPDNHFAPSESKAARTTHAADVLLLVLGVAAAVSLVCACLGIFAVSAYQVALVIPTRAPSPTPSDYPATQTAIANYAWGLTQTAMPTTTPTLTPTPSITPTVTASPIVAVEQPVTPTPQVPGPWLVLSNGGDGLSLLPSDGKSLIRLTSDRIVAPADLRLAISPAGAQVAYVTTTDSEQIRDLILKVINLPDGAVAVEIPLAAEQAGQMASTITPESFEGLRAIVNQDSLAWSPDGGEIAFIGTANGINADLFVFSLRTNQVRRLSNTPVQEYSPSWSPDGSYLVVSSAASFTNAERKGDVGLWSVSAEGGPLVNLNPLQEQAVSRIDWLSSDKILIASRSVECGNFNLRQVDLKTGKEEQSFGGCFTAAARDPETGNVLMVVNQKQVKDCSCGKVLEHAGVYLFPGGLGDPRLLALGEDVEDVVWLKNLRQFYVRRTDGWSMAFSPAGTLMELQYMVKGLLPVYSPSRGLTAWARKTGEGQPGLWVAGTFESPRKIFDQPSELALWSPDGSRLIFFSSGQVYQAIPPRFDLKRVAEFEGNLLQAVWGDR